MNKIKIIKLSILIFLFSILSTFVQAKKGERLMLLEKPYFTIYLEASDCNGPILINGQEISFEDGSPVAVEYPVNQWISSGVNTLTMNLVYGDNKKFINNANCKMTLRVRESGSDSNINTTIATLNYSAALAKTGTGLEGNTPAHRLNSNNKFEQDSAGDITIEEAIGKINNDSAFVVSRKIILPKINLPRWSFFSSDNLTGLKVPDVWGSMDDDTHDGIVKEILPIYRKIWTALKNKDIESIMPLYAERNREMDAAFYNQTGTLLKQLKTAFDNAVADPERKLQAIDETDITAHVFDNDKLVNLQHNNNTAVIYFKYDDGMVEYYDIVLRKQQGKWIITR